ncbi:MAG: hypothetical protein IJA15_04775 [Clostridia bacterium]|nr:hypothetical protein [Clostridia bacterium]
MKKKNLIVLLLLPFIVSTLCIVTVNFTYNIVDVNISGIEWEYKDYHPFQFTNEIGHKLSAKGVNRNNYKLAEGNELVWSVVNKNGEDEPLAEIVEQNGEYYLKPLKEGEVYVRCSTKNGDVSRRMTAILFENAFISLRPEISLSGANIDPTIYYGQYDLSGTAKMPASFDMVIEAQPENILPTITYECTENISFDQNTGKISILKPTPKLATLTIHSDAAASRSYSFEIVENGVNVYTYQDLLNCTNKSENGGEIVVLRKHFQSLNEVKATKENNVVCFGNYDAKNNAWGFKYEIDSFPTTYNHNYIDQWNAYAKTQKGVEQLSMDIKVGLRVTKDFYGNGYTLNFHNLAYPKDVEPSDANIAKPAQEDLFRGPLPFYALGTPKDKDDTQTMVKAFGQDNIGMYLAGSNITVNDVNLSNCDNVAVIQNLDYVGTVLEVAGDNITVKNSRIKNGKNVVRAFSANQFTLKNSYVHTARNFLVFTGSNDFVPINGEKEMTFNTLSGEKTQSRIYDYLRKGGAGDDIMNEFIFGSYSNSHETREQMRQLLAEIQNTLNQRAGVENNYAGSTVIEDCLFANSGIAAIGIESQFNGPFLYSGSPSTISDVEGTLGPLLAVCFPFQPQNIAGVSYPVEVEVTGNTMFFDYKDIDKMDVTGLIDENIAQTVKNMLPGQELPESLVTMLDGIMDKFFPVKDIIKREKSQYFHKEEFSQYVNIPVAFYGGGLNLSKVEFSGPNAKYISHEEPMDLLDTYLRISGSDDISMATIQSLLTKMVTTVIGYEPFRFHFVKNGYLYGKTANDEILENNAMANSAIVQTP